MSYKELFNTRQYETIITELKNKKDANIWELFWLCKAYYKLEQYTEAKAIYAKYLQLKPEDNRLLDTYLWIGYKTELSKKEDIDETKFITCADYILANSTQDDLYSPYIRTVFKVVDFYKAKNTTGGAEKVYEYLNKLTPDTLPTDPRVFNIKGKDKNVCSFKESWYSNYTKICLTLERFEECIAYCEEAIRVFNFDITEDSRVFFEYKKAKALIALDKVDEAKTIVEKLVAIKPTFYLKRMLGDIALTYNDINKAYFHYYDALLSRDGQLKGQVETLKQIVNLKYSDNDLVTSKLHCLLIKQLREKEGWKEDKQIAELLNILADTEVDENRIDKQCKKIWQEGQHNLLPSYTGVIYKLIGNNNQGFIKTDDEDIFFMLADILGRKDTILNSAVEFNIVNTFDKKKQQLSKKAINIKLLD